MDCHEYMSDLMSDFALTVSRGLEVQQCVDQGRVLGKNNLLLYYMTCRLPHGTFLLSILTTYLGL